MSDILDLASICKRLRYDILSSTTKAGSGHPTSSLSAVELMATLVFGGFFRQDIATPHDKRSDRLIFSKGHAAPLLYALYEAAGVITAKKLLKLRTFKSPLQGHPVPEVPFVDVATGSLGQGLSVGVGMALGIRLMLRNRDIAMKREPTVWVLLGDSESAEGQVWEAMALASKYRLNNLVGILDVNRLGQNSETGLGWDMETYRKRVESFGWEPVVVKNGHNLEEVGQAFKKADKLNTVHRQKPVMIIARTVKGKGISFLEDKEGWHGKPVPEDMLPKALKELGKVDLKRTWEIQKPEVTDEKLNTVLTKLEKFQFAIGGGNFRDPVSAQSRVTIGEASTCGEKIPGRIYGKSDDVATREAFGQALLELGKQDQRVVALDAEVANSTYLNFFGKEFPDRFFEIYIDEENMASVALGLSKTGFIPYFSTFAAFLTRAFDQIRMMQYSLTPDTNVNIVGSHAGVSIGQDGPSQMGLEDIAMMRTIQGSVVLYPADAVAAQKLILLMHQTSGIKYMRTTRGKTPVLYKPDESFPLGGFKLHRPITRYTGSEKNTEKASRNKILVIAAGITLHEALKAQRTLEKDHTYITVVDLYSIKPLDVNKLKELIKGVKKIIVVEDHFEAGGMGEALAPILKDFTHLCVRKVPRSGTPNELLDYEKINENAIISAVTE